MRMTYLVVALVAGALAAAGYLLGTRPSLLAKPTHVTALDETNQIAARFGQSTAVMVVAHAREGTVVDAGPLADLDALNKKLTRSGACASVLSFFALPQMIVGEDETEIRNMVEALPQNEQERDALKQRLREHANGVGELLSADLSRALFICPLSAPARLDDAAAIATAAGYEHLQLTRVGPAGLGQALANDFLESSLLYLVLALVISITGRPLVRMRAGLLAEIVVLQAALVYLVHPIVWPASRGALPQLLGPGFDRAQTELDEVTGLSRLVLIEVTADLNSAKDVRAIAQGCARLATDDAIKGKVSCPTDVLLTLAGALTGDRMLPANDEQLKALWFFAGERPELSLIFTPDKKGALVRVRLEQPVSAEALDTHLLRAFTGLSVAAGGMPLVDEALGRLRVVGLSLLALAAALAFLLGRRLHAGNVALGEALLAPALLIKVGLVSRLLLAAGVVVLFAAVGARSKRDQSSSHPKEEPT
jgi:hypothetical protein